MRRNLPTWWEDWDAVDLREAMKFVESEFNWYFNRPDPRYPLINEDGEMAENQEPHPVEAIFEELRQLGLAVGPEVTKMIEEPSFSDNRTVEERFDEIASDITAWQHLVHGMTRKFFMDIVAERRALLQKSYQVIVETAEPPQPEGTKK